MRGFPDRRYFARAAKETGFRAGPLETLFRLTDLLGEIVRALGDELSLRGGTALNLLHLDLPRLSVDIDLDFIGSADAAESQRRRPDLIQQLEALVRAAGYEVAQERPSYAMAHLRLRYENAEGLPALIRLDVNFLDRVPVLPPERRPLRHPFGEDLAPAQVQTLALPELAAAKAIALARRALARDLFDTAMLAPLPDLDVGLMRTALVVRGSSYPPPSPADYSLEMVGRVRSTSWRSEVLALARRPLPIGVEEARQRAAKLLERATRFEEGQREFLLALERGELRPELLPHEEVHRRVALNPGLLWRLRVGAEALEER